MKTHLFKSSLIISFFIFNVPLLNAQTPWGPNAIDGGLLKEGIGPVTCGTLTEFTVPNQFTFGLKNFGAISKGATRPLNAVQSYHDSRWTVSQLGSVFGVAYDRNRHIYVTASANFSSVFGFGSDAKNAAIGYGSIGGGTDNLSAAGTVYKIDGITGEPTVFSVLPQQSFTFTHRGCEASNDVTRTTGPGLGNIVYDKCHNQFFVSNFEDGKIYRISSTGTILNSWEATNSPFVADNGSAGYNSADANPYGLTISPDCSHLYFGTIEINQNPTQPAVWSVPLDAGGNFVGSTATLNRRLFGDVTGNGFGGAGSIGAGFTSQGWICISDLKFNPDGELVVAMRTGCYNNFATSHNHAATVWILEDINGDDVFNDVHDNVDMQYRADQTSNDDIYGGIGIYEDKTTGNYDYVISSSDTRTEAGPHGFIIFPHNYTDNNSEAGGGGTHFRLQPSASVSYIGGSFEGLDVKGFGGDQEVLGKANCNITANFPCAGDTLKLVDNALTSYTWNWTGPNGFTSVLKNPIIPNVTSAAAGTYTLAVSDSCGYINTCTVVVSIGSPLPSFTLSDATICDEDFGTNENVVNLTSLITTGPTSGTWTDLDGSGLLSGTLVTGTSASAGNTYRFVYTLSDTDGIPPLCNPKTDTLTITVNDCIFDLALNKTINSSSPALADGMAMVGETIIYNVTVYNQGNITATNIDVAEQFPCGLIPVGATSATIPTLASGANATVMFTFTINPSSCAPSIDPYLNFAYINEADINGVTQTGDIDSPFGPMSANELGTMPNMPGDNDLMSAGDTGIGSQDDADPANLEIFDLALAKVIMAPIPVDGYKYGDTIRFNICVTSQGSIDASEVTISDYVPNGLMYITTANNTSEGWTGSGSTITNVVEAAEIPGGTLTFLEQVCKTIDLKLVAGQTNYVNRAEISGAKGEVPNAMGGGFITTTYTFDNDGVFNTTSQDEAGGNAGSTSDAMNTLVTNPAILGNGTGMPNSILAATDADHADPAFVPVVDFAIRKTITTMGPFAHGDTITYNLEVFNQGNVSGAQIVLNDYVPSHLRFETSINPGWVPMTNGTSLTVMRAIAGPIAAGASAMTSIRLIALPGGTSAAAYTNHSEINSIIGVAGEPFGTGSIGQLDADSSPDSNPSNDNGADGSNAVNNPADNVVSGTGGAPMAAGTNPLTDEDDADPAFLAIHDVALTKMGETGSFDIGDTVTYTITVFNQGNQPLDSIKVIDYIPAGLTYIVTSTNTTNMWTTMGTNAMAIATIANGRIPAAGVAPGASYVFSIDMAVDTDAVPSNLTNSAEIVGSGDTGGLDQDDDGDSTSDGTPNNGNDNTTDNSTSGTGAGGSDEDDSDPHTIMLSLYELGSLVFTDPNDNGILDMGESGINGVPVFLYLDADMDGIPDGPAIAMTVTAGGGIYLFDSLNAGTYIVGITPNDTLGRSSNDATATISVDDDGANDDHDHGTYDPSRNEILSGSVTLSSGDETETESGPGGNQDNTNNGGTNGDMTIDFGLVPLVSIGSTVWADNNNDGLLNNLEQGISGITVNLYADADNNGIPDGPAIATTLTNGSGSYLFDSLIIGKYIVSVIPNSSYQVSSTSTPTTLPYEADSEVDNNDNGIQSAAGAEIFSTTIDLTLNGEPIESGANPGASQDNADDNNGDMTVDFGLVPYLSIGSTVFFDPNNNGIQEFTNPQETGISGITVHLVRDGNGDGVIDLTEQNTFIQSTITNLSGNYLFDSLMPGLYAVVAVPNNAAPISSTGASLANNDLDLTDDGIQPFSGSNTISSNITLAGSSEPVETAGNPGAAQDDGADTNGNMTVDFGFVPNLSIGSTVFYDRDLDGLHDFTEPLEDGIAGVTINLYFDANNDGMINGTEATTPIYTTTTDADGNYYFGNLIPGNYQVGVTPDASAPNSSPAGVTDTADNNQDSDDNGTQAAPGGNTLSPIINLATGLEANEAVVNPGEDQDDAADLNGNMTVDFGFIPTMSIGSTVFADPNNNGIQDVANPLEDGIAGVTVNLYYDADNDGFINGTETTLILTTTTNANGDYFFGNLPEGNYVVGIVPPGNAPVSSTPALTADGTDGNDNGTQSGGPGSEILSNVVNLNGGSETHTESGDGSGQDDAFENNGDMTIDFGLVPNQSIGSTVFYDMNNDGDQDTNPQEFGITGVTVDLLYDENNDGVFNGAELTPVATTITSATGDYFFGVLPGGNYQVVISTTPTGAPMSSTDLVSTTLDNNTDNDDNGVQTGGPGTQVISPTINLSNNAEPLNAAENAQTGGAQDNSVANPDNNGNMTVDFGFVPMMTLGSTVFYDPNNNGIQDLTNPLEDGIAGVTVQLWQDTDSDNIGDYFIGTDITDANGNYLFEMLSPGSYQVVVLSNPASAPTSSTGQVADAAGDNMDNGAPGTGSFASGTTSQIIVLSPGTEPVEPNTNPGAGQDGPDGSAPDLNGDMTVDFGFIPNMSIGSTVFADPNNDGIQSGLIETGIAGVTVNLYFDADNDGDIEGSELTPVATTITDAFGNYLFDTLPVGNYQVGITPSASAPTSSTPNLTADGIDGNDNGNQPGGSNTQVLSNVFNLSAGAEPTTTETAQGGNQDGTTGAPDNNGDMTIDFGLIPNMSIGSTVFFDPNDNGVQDLSNPLEDGIQGVGVQLLYDNDNDPMTPMVGVAYAVTDANGNYLFDSLPAGNYQVQVVALSQAAPNSSTGADIVDNQEDGDDNGTQTVPGGTVSSPVITLSAGNEPTEAGTYPGNNQDGTIGAPETNGDMTIDFGFVPSMSVGSTVFADVNNDGIQSGPLETGIAGVTVNLYYDADNDGDIEGPELVPVATMVTDAMGNYFFDSIPSGNFQVGILPPANAPTSSTPNLQSDSVDGNDNGSQSGGSGMPILSNIFTLNGDLESTTEPNQGGNQDGTAGAPDNDGDMTIDFGLVPNQSIGSTVFNDQNMDGIQSGTLEVGIPGVTVQLFYDNDNNPATDMVLAGTTVTDAMGNYEFDTLPAGNYQVVIPTPSAGAPNSSPSGVTDTNDNQQDGDDNGTQAAPGGSTSSPIIVLSDAGEPSTESNQGGTQDGIPGQPENQGDMTVDFGFVPNMSLGSTVFADPNNDGIQSGPLETGIAGVVVSLYFDANNDGTVDATELMTPVATTVTDAMGNYFFDTLPAGNFIVGITPPTNAPTSSTPNLTADGADGNDNGSQAGGSGTQILSNQVTLTPLTEPTSAETAQGGTQDGTAGAPDNNGDMTIDFGLIPNQSIGSTVFYDNNNNGIQDGTGITQDLGISGVTVQLFYDNDNDPMTPMVLAGTTLTDGMGNYEFDSLPAGNYMIVIPTAPASAPTSSTLDNVGGVTDIDSNDNGVQPGGAGTLVSSGIIVLSNEGETLTEPGQGGTQDGTPNQPDNQGDMTVDFGFAPYVSVGSNVFVDSDNNGLDDGTANEPGIAGVTVQVYNSVTNMLVGTSVTDMNGNWFVDSLLPGTYYAVINTVNPVYPTSSTTTDTNDNQEDNDDNGIQTGGPNTAVTSPVFTLTGNGEPLDAVETGPGGLQDVSTVPSQDNDGDMTIDFGFVPYFSIGNQVWIDDAAGSNGTDYDGIRNGSEVGINGVTVQLWNATTNTLVATTTTMTVGANMGMYLFDTLLPGNYYVVIPGSQMMPGGPLDDYLSSSGTFNAGGPYEVPAGIDPDTNPADNDDNGTFNTNPAHFFAVVSQVVTLGGAPEPTAENPDNDPNTQDIYENLTVDFGFVPKVFDLALRKTTMAMIPIDAFNMQIEFMIEVFNQGNMDADNIEITDYIPSGFSYMAALNNPLGWSYTAPNATMTLPNVLPAGESTTVSLYLSIQMSNMNNAFANHAEISYATDTLGNNPIEGPYGPLVDIDSTPDDDGTNDAGSDGSSADNGADNVITGNGEGGIDDGIAAGDEDDADPSIVRVVDVALFKELNATPAGPYRYGDNVSFRIGVVNQGNVPLRNIVVKDYAPAGLTYLAGNNLNGWSNSGTTATRTMPGPLDMWDTMYLNITYQITKITPATNATEDSWTNVAEISAMEGMLTPGSSFIDVTAMDIDGALDANPNNNNGGEANSPDDGNTGGNGMLGEDDDHSDPALVPIYDVALTKKFVDPDAIYLFGDVIPMNIEVINQGNTELYNIEVVDYVPGSLTTVGAPANTGWGFPGVSGPMTAAYVIPGPIAPGASVIVPLSLVFQSAGAFEDYINYAEVSEFENEGGDSAAGGDILDADSTPDVMDNNDDGGVPSFPGAPSNTDDYVDGNGYAPGGAPGQDVAAEDEDDHDPLLLGFVDLALTKVVQGTGQIEPGQPVTFTITITNQGTIPSGSVTVTDYIPTGFVLDDADWTSVAGNRATKTVSVANGDFAAPGLQYLQTETIDITIRPLPATQRGAYVNYAEISGNTAPNGQDILALDIDSDGDTDNTNDIGGMPASPDGSIVGADNVITGTGTQTGGGVGNNNPATDEDDHDPAVVCITPRPNIVGDFYVCPGESVTYGLEEFAPGIPYFNPANRYTWTLTGPAVIEGSSNGPSVTLTFSDDPADHGELIQLKILEETAFPFCMGMDVQQIEIESLTALSCNDKVNISVDENCEALVTPSMILEGQPYPDASYSVTITTQSGLPVANPLDRSQIGKTLKVSIIQECFGQSCWGEIVVEDKIGPTIECGDVTEIYCYEVNDFVAQTAQNATFMPTISDNCDDVRIIGMSTSKNLVQCGDGGTISRTWIVSDSYGNTASCVQEFEVVNEVVWRCPTPQVSLGCNADLSPAAIANAVGGAAAYPHFINDGDVTNVNGVCAFNTGYTDTESAVCGTGCSGNKKVVRDWKVLNWCTGEISRCTQIIKAVDEIAPTFTVRDTTVSTAPWSCEGDFFAPNPRNVHDNCDDNPTWRLESSLPGVQIIPAMLNGQPHPLYRYRVVGAPKGELTLRYVASDCCDNERVIESTVTIVDRTAPTPVSKRDIVLSLVPDVDANGNESGVAKMFATSLDNGSYDNCSDVRLEVRRPEGSSCGNIGTNGHNNNSTFSSLLPANLAINMPYSANDNDGGAFVKFCCDDLSTAGADFDGDGTNDVGYHKVVLRVWDDGNMDGIIGNVGDNWNESWAIVKVENKVPGVITCPPNVTVSCDQGIETFESSTATKSIVGVNFSKTGVPTATGLCKELEIRFRDRLILNQCKIGTIIRTFVINDNGVTRTCEQVITVSPITGNAVWTINFPSDWSETTNVSCDGPSATDIAAKGPISIGGPCDAIGLSTKVEQFDIEEGVCRKWRVEYKYINWCNDEQRGPFYKFFKYSDTELPVLSARRDTMYGVINEDCSWTGSLTKSATDNGGCIANDPNRWLKWTAIVDLWGDGTNDLEYSSFLPVGNDVNNLANGNIDAIRDDNSNGIKDIYVAPTRSGDKISIRLPKIEGNMSNHKVVWKVTDGCGNYASHEEFFMVIDKKAPTPVCIPLSTALMNDPDGSGPLLPMVELWAIDFVDKAYDNCTADDKLLHTFENVAPQVENKNLGGAAPNVININTAHYFNATGGLAPHPVRAGNVSDAAVRAKYLRGEEGIQLWIPTSRSSAKVWTSTSLVNNAPTKVDVSVTVWDEKFNKDFCWTTVNLSLNSATPVSGNVSTEGGTPVREVEVIANAALPEYPKVDMTDASGNYAMDASIETTIRGHKDGDDINGVSTLDLVMIQRHILGLAPLGSPYKVIAADATNDGKVTASDLTEIRKLILGVTTEYGNNDSWRFPVESAPLDANNPFPYEEQIIAVPNVTPMSNLDFVAIKIGDVNGNAKTNAQDGDIEARTSKALGMEIETKGVSKSELVVIPVRAKEDVQMYGYQTTMNIAGGEYVSIEPGVIDMTSTNVANHGRGRITMSYASRDMVNVKAGDILFTMTLRADKATTTDQMLRLSDDITKSESYIGTDMEVGKVNISARMKTADEAIILMQNDPNPWKSDTKISWYMPVAGKVTLKVYDGQGKEVNVRTIDASRGLNTETYTKGQIGTSSGVFYYKLESGAYTATKKMILVE